MEREEFEQLKRGDIGRRLTGVGDSFVVDARLTPSDAPGIYRAVRSIDISNPVEWQRVSSEREANTAIAHTAEKLELADRIAELTDRAIKAESALEPANPAPSTIDQQETNAVRRTCIEFALAQATPESVINIQELALLWGVTKPRMVNLIHDIGFRGDPTFVKDARIAFPARAVLEALLRHLEGGDAVHRHREFEEAAMERADAIADAADGEDVPIFATFWPRSCGAGAARSIEFLQDINHLKIVRIMIQELLQPVEEDPDPVTFVHGKLAGISMKLVGVNALAFHLANGEVYGYRRSTRSPNFFIYQP